MGDWTLFLLLILFYVGGIFITHVVLKLLKREDDNNTVIMLVFGWPLVLPAMILGILFFYLVIKGMQKWDKLTNKTASATEKILKRRRS
jgi:uncharacterized BrkB/YihY/UPF0761 family membrane protein